MIVTYPDYYEKFKCIADKCTDTCCVGWQIVIDKTTAEKYKNLTGSFGEKIRNLTTTDPDGDVIFINKNNRCPFLNSNNLCDIYINIGEENLCHTCKMFPRFYETFGGLREMGLSLSCPVANDLILNDTTFSFTQDFNDEEPEFNDLDAECFIALKSAREKLLNFAKTPLDMGKKLSAVLDYAEKIKPLIDENSYDEIRNLHLDENSYAELNIDNDIFSRLEYLTENGKKILTETPLTNSTYSDKYTNILVYFIYRYFLKSIYKSNTYESLRFAVFSIKVISAIEKSGVDLSDATRIYSKEVEHSEFNLNSVLEFLS